jgi:hypothetical protein
VSDEPLSDAQVNALVDKDIALAVAALDENANWWRALDGLLPVSWTPC